MRVRVWQESSAVRRRRRRRRSLRVKTASHVYFVCLPGVVCVFRLSYKPCLPSYNPKPLWWHFLFKLLLKTKRGTKEGRFLCEPRRTAWWVLVFLCVFIKAL